MATAAPARLPLRDLVAEDPDRLRAVAHPVRHAILARLIATPSPMSARGLERAEVGSLGVLAYHVRILADAGLIEVAHAIPVRGATETFWRVRRGA